MSKFDSDDSQAAGYFLPEESQHRLKKLREYVEFLSHLAQPRRADEEQERLPEICVGQVAICLGLLEEQLRLVLEAVSWPAHRGEEEAALGSDTGHAMEESPDGAGGRYLFGVTLEQVDTLHRLIDMISAHGDVVTASRDAELADHTLPVLGQAIFDGARTVQAIIRQVESQRLGQARGSQTGVGEEQAVYRVDAPWPAPMPIGREKGPRRAGVGFTGCVPFFQARPRSTHAAWALPIRGGGSTGTGPVPRSRSWATPAPGGRYAGDP
jgi:hypothetical protein